MNDNKGKPRCSARSAAKAMSETRRIEKRSLRRSDRHELGKLAGSPVDEVGSSSAIDEGSDGAFFWQKKDKPATEPSKSDVDDDDGCF